VTTLKKAWHCHKLRLGLLAMAFVGCSLTFQWATKTTTHRERHPDPRPPADADLPGLRPALLKEKLDRRALGAAVIA